MLRIAKKNDMIVELQVALHKTVYLLISRLSIRFMLIGIFLIMEVLLMQDDMHDIGNRIKEKRKELGLTQTDIFEKCGINSGALSKIENGIRTPSVTLFYKLSQVLNCDMEWLITGSSSNSQNYFSKDEEKLLNKFRNLPQKDRDELLEIAEMKLRRLQKSGKELSSHSGFTGENNLLA